MRRFACLACGLAALLAMGCENGSIPSKTPTEASIEKEMELLASEHDLNAMLARSGEGIVDWQLSREFAQLVLDDFIATGEFPASSELWDIPIAIYDDAGKVRYYEFRIVDNGQVIAAIAGNARENLGGPISRVFKMDGYMDELTELYDAGALKEEDIPRIVDNDYPSYAVASVAVTRSGDVDFDKLLNPQTGKAETGLTKVMTVKEMIEAYPDAFTAGELAAVDAAIADYGEQMAKLWSMAKANKGKLNNFTFRGSKKNPRTAVDQGRINKVLQGKTYPTSYGWCAPTATGFILDFLCANNIGNTGSWNKLSFQEKIKSLEDKMNTGFLGIEGAVAPWNLGNAVSYYSDYKISTALGVVPNTSIENNLPGINLRGLDCSSWDVAKGGMHYRNVVAYREDGWWIFKWSSIKVHDGNNVDDGWETYNPFYHLFSYNLVKK